MSIFAARHSPRALALQCRQHGCDIGRVTLYPISGGWVLLELRTGDGNNENAFANHVASVCGSPTCEACPRMEFLQERRIRKNFVSFVPTARTGGATAGHGSWTCGRCTKHASPPFPLELFEKIHLHRLYRPGMVPARPPSDLYVQVVRTAISNYDGRGTSFQLLERGVSALFGAGCQLNMLNVQMRTPFWRPFFFSQKNTKISATRIAVNS